MALTRLDNLISSKTGKYLYVSPDDFNASDELNNRGNSPIRPFKSLQRAFIEISRYSYQPGPDNDRFDQFTVMVMPGKHYVDNRPGLVSTDGIDAFTFDQAMGEWADSSNLDISDPNNKLYLFNNTEGGAIIPRGSSIIGYDLRRTSVHPLFVPDPADMLEQRSAIFNVTGGCYFWQFTIRDGDLEPASPLYDSVDGVGKVYYQNGKWNELAVPNFSHHKLTVFEYADKEELSLYYQKVAKAFSQYQPTIDDANEFGDRIEETRIVGPLSDIRAIESIKCIDSSPAQTITVEVTTKVNHGYFKNQFIAIESNGLDDAINGTFGISSLDSVDKRKFSYKIPGTVSALGTTTNLVSGTTYTTANGLNANAVVKAEVDSVESASPYVFNCSIRSTWGICGIWANGLKATGFKSMVIAQYTGVSLQKDDRAFIRYDEFTNTFNQASLTDAFATVPYHTKGDAFWKDDWRNFHVRASEDAFIQCVSIFAVGYADHFLMESGGDMSITNSNSNFGNTSLHAKGHKGYSFNQDKGGYITDIVPPQQVEETAGNTGKQSYYTLDVYASNDQGNHTKIYLGDDSGYDPKKRLAASIGGYRIGAKTDDKLFVKLNPRTAGANNEFFATLEPSGFKKFTAAADILNPSGVTINNKTLDAADRIEANKEFIMHEAYDRVLAKYPTLKTKESITITKCRRDVGYLIDATVQDLRLGGNVNTIQAGESYFVGNQLSYINHELNETLEGYNYARDLAIAAMRNFTYLRTGTVTTSGSAIVNIGDTSGVVEGMTVADYDPSMFTDGKLNSGATRPGSPTIPNNTFVKKIIDSTSIELGDNAQTAEKKVQSNRHGNARELILANKTFIATEAYERMLLDFPGYTPSTGYNATTGKAKCIDDLEKAIDAIAANVGYGGNAETWDASYFYTSGSVVDLAAKKTETLAAFNYCKDMAIQVMRKENVFIYGTHGLTQSSITASDPITDDPSPELVADRNGDAHDLIEANKNLIAAEAVERMISTSSTQKFTPSGATYDPTTGDFVITSAAHGLTAATNHTATGASYTPADGKLVITIANHGFTNGQKILIKDGSLNFECAMDAGATIHSYPRPSDPFSGKWLTISNKTTNTFEVNVGASPQVTYTPTTGTTYNPSTGLMVLNIGNHNLRGSTSHTPTAAAYNPTTGVVTLTVVNHGFSRGDRVKLNDNSLTFTCAEDGNGTQHTYPRSSDPISGKWQEITNITQDTFDIVVLSTTPSTNVTAHTFISATTNALIRGGESIRLAANSLKFSCGFGGATGNAAEKTYPRSSDPFYNKPLTIESATVDTITVQVLTTIPSTNTDVHTFVSATAGAVETGGSYAHSFTGATSNGILAESDSVRIDYEALKFTCDMDGHSTQHAYPRISDPAASKSLPLTAKTTDTFTINVGKSLDKKHDVTAASYNTATGDLELTLNKHSLIKGQSIRIADNSLTFSCSKDSNATNHTYPRNNITTHTATGAVYNPTTGVVTLTVANHGFENDDRVQVVNDSLTFTCAEDSNATNHTYPRASDPISGKDMPVSNVTTNTFDIQVLTITPSTNITAHTFVSAAANGIVRRVDKAYRNALPITKVGSSFHTATDATYTPKDGILELTIPAHGLSSGDRVKISRDSLVFKCAMDNYGTEHKYPRASDPTDGDWLSVSAVTTNTFKVNVGVAGADQSFTPTDGTYNASSGALVLTIGTHTLTVGESVVIDNESLSFKCAMDNYTTAQSYPRVGKDKASTRSLPITSVTGTTITVNVGAAGTNKTFKPTAATYNADTGYMSLTVGQHGLAVGSDITLKDNSLVFTCSKDSNATQHSYPRPGTDPYAGKSLTIESVGSSSHTATGATYNPITGEMVVTSNAHEFEAPKTLTPTLAAYNPTTGVMTITSTAHGLDNGDFVQITPNSLTFTCALDGNTSQKTYPRSNDPASGSNLPISNVTANTFDVQVLAITPSTNTSAHTFVSAAADCISTGGDYVQFVDDSLTFSCALGGAGVHTYVGGTAAGAISVTGGGTKDVTGATYDPGTGVLVLTSVGHGLTTSNTIKIAADSLDFTCDKDGHGSTHSYPRTTDPIYNTATAITAVTADTISINVGVATAGKSYPRKGFDDASGKWLQVTAVTTNTFTVNVGEAGDATAGLHNFVSATADGIKKQDGTLTVNVGSADATVLTPTAAAYTPADGKMVLTMAGHGLSNGQKIRIAKESLKFTCAQDSNNTTHTYPRATDPAYNSELTISDVTADTVTVQVLATTPSTNVTAHVFTGVDDKLTATGAAYNAKTGIMTLTVAGHGLVAGERVKIADNSITLTCAMDGHFSQKTYPRATDPTRDKWIPVTNITANTFDVFVGKSPLVSHTPTAVDYNPTTGIMEMTIGTHGYVIGDNVKIAKESLIFTCDQDSNATEHAYPRAATTSHTPAAGTTYNPTTGVMTLTVANHGFKNNDWVKLADGAVTFTCAQDSDASDHAYPRASDPISKKFVQISNVTTNTFDIQVLASAPSTNTTAHTFKSSLPNSITKKTDPYSDSAYQVTGVTSTTISVQVLATPPSTNTTAHTFVTALPNAVTAGGDYDHTFVSAISNGISRAVVLVGDQYTHTFVKSIAAAVEYTPQSAHTWVSGKTNCVRHLPDQTHQFVRAMTNGIQKQNGTITVNVGASAAGDQYAHTFVSATSGAVTSGGNYAHTFKSAKTNSVHKTFSVAGNRTYHSQDCVDDVRDLLEAIADNVAYGGNDKTWDAAYSYKTGNHVAGVSKTVTAATYTPADGNLVLTIGTHSNKVGERVKIPQGALTFTCAKDSNATNHTYPRATDPIATYDPTITAVTGTTITVNVGPANDNTAGTHTFVSAAKQVIVGGEEKETNIAFEHAKHMAGQVIRNQKVLVTGSHGLTQTYDTTITVDTTQNAAPAGANGDAYNLINSNANLIASEAYERMIVNHPGFLPPTGNKQDCIDDIKDFVVEVAFNTGFGGNDRVWDMAQLYVTGAHVAGEEAQTIEAFTDATQLMIQAMRNEKILIIGKHGISQVYDNTITSDTETPLNNKAADAFILLTVNKNFIADVAMARMLANNPSYQSPTGYTQEDCKDDLKDIVDVLAHNVKFGGNDRIWDTANMYVGGAVLPIKKAETVEAINHLRDIAIEVVRDEDVTVVSGQTALSQVKYPTTGTGTGVDGSNPKCATESAAVTTLTLILTNAITTNSSLNSVTRTAATYKCTTLESTINTLSTIAQNAITNPASLSGSKASVSTASYNPTTGVMELTVGAHSYNVGESVNIPNESLVFTCAQDSNATHHKYPRATDPMGKASSNITAVTATTISVQVLPSIPSTNTTIHTFVNSTDDITIGGVKRTESVGKCQNVRSTIDTLFKIVTDTISTPSSLNNITRNISNGKCQNVASTISTLYGILTNAITTPTSLDLIDRTPSPTGLSTGNAVNANASTSNTYLYFTLTAGRYTSTYTPIADDSITQDTNYPQCNTVADAVRQYFANISTIIQTGLNTVTRVQPSSASSNLSSRATIFTLKDWTPGPTSGSNPHQLETGTAVRLVPRPRYNTSTNQYVTVDKRNVRLPNGFDTNTKYYVIAPGRTTQPENYSGTTEFNGSDQTKLMLASSKENAAAGIYIHSAEVEAIDPDIEIDIYQFVLDDKYDLHQYKCVLDSGAGAVSGGIKTDVPHIFDIQTATVTSHKVFFRKNEGGSLPTVSTAQAADPDIADSGTAKILNNKFFYARYQNFKVLTVHKTHADAISNTNPIVFQSGSYDFSVFADKRESPMRYDPTHVNAGTTPTIYGKWYLQVKNESTPNTADYDAQSILSRFKDSTYSNASGNNKTNDSWFERLKDEREADERIFRLRYVIPKYLKSVRDPLNGFTIKMRKDETRKLLPQRLMLKPVSGSITQAKFYNTADSGQATEIIGYTDTDFDNTSLNLDRSKQYDPYKKDTSGSKQYAKNIRTTNTYVDLTIESAKFITSGSDTFTEITVVNPRVENVALKNEIFTTVKITAPQGGTFAVNATANVDSGAGANRLTWSGNSTGYGYLHAVLQVPGTTTWHLILKGVVGDIKYSVSDNIRFSQGTVFADLLNYPDYGKSLVLKDLIKEKFPEYYYRQNGAKVYTITPGDIITDDANVQFYVESVEDTGELDDTFYIFNVKEIQRRIFDQQDGIFYLTAVRGNMSPYPTGAGNQNNFRDFKFSQPISKLYPLNYKNDPVWFKQIEPTAVDPGQTYSAADNYVHGLVTVNDFKGSLTKESVIDMLATEALKNNEYTQVSSTVDNRLRAQKGNASSGSEDRLIPISGDATTISQKRLYVELRRPSIARAGNHTFEYLGFGPGNYSTGFPARQEVLLSTTQDFYAQSKKQNGGLVFYTGLNSNGDLYIGNRKIDAITGEEVFLESASLVDSADEDDAIGNLVTTFDTPVTFNEYITVNGGQNSDKTSTFNSPITVNVPSTVRDTTLGAPTVGVLKALTVISNVSDTKDDKTLDTTTQQKNRRTLGNIRIAGNKISSSIFEFNQRGSEGAGQGYKIQTHCVGTSNLASNVTPDQDATYSSLQVVSYNAAGAPLSGDILLKGESVMRSGSLGWVLANAFVDVEGQIQSLTSDGTNTLILTWKSGVTNTNVTTGGVQPGMELKITGYSDNKLNGTWPINVGLVASGNTLTFSIDPSSLIATAVVNWSTQPTAATAQVAASGWKELGVLGAETIRTDTQKIGEYKLGVNTVARAAHADHETAFVSDATDPLANLDVVGTAWISGKTIENFAAHTTYAARTLTPQDHAFMVGGDSSTPANAATLRASTTNNGRVGINTTLAEMQSALTVKGTVEVTENAVFQKDVAINGGGAGSSNAADVTTTITDGTVNLFMDTGFVGLTSGTFPANGLKLGGSARNIEIGNVATASQNIKIGNTSTDSIITIGDSVDGSNANKSKITIGGAFASTESDSFVQIDAKALKTAGDVILGTRRGLSDTTKFESSSGTVEFLSGNSATNIVDFATNSSTLRIAGQGGTTTIRNNLIVDATSRFNGDVTLCGGNASYSFVGRRAQAGSTIQSHTSGVLGNNLFDSNVDLITVLVSSANTGELNKIDTAGSGDWGGTAYQQTPAGQSAATFPTLTGDKYYLPLKRTPYDVNGTQYYNENDILLIDTVEQGTEYAEFVKITRLPQINSIPYYVEVQRQPFGTLSTVSTEHPDTTNIYKCIVQYDATWTTAVIDGSGSEDNVYLSQFGGVLTGSDTRATGQPGDYVIISRPTGGADGEIFELKETLSQVAKKLSVKNGCDTTNPITVFEVNSVTGDITINGDQYYTGALTLNGSCSTPYVNATTNKKLTITNGGGTKTFEVDTCTGDTNIGNKHGHHFCVSESFGTSPAAYTTTDVVHVYKHDPQSNNTTLPSRPFTVIASQVVAATTNIQIQANYDAFSIGDLVAIYSSGQMEIIQITAAPYVTGTDQFLPTSSNATYPNGGRGVEGTTAIPAAVGLSVVKLNKAGTTTLLEDLPGTRAGRAPTSGKTFKARTPNTSDTRLEIGLVNADLIQPKLDYIQFIRIGSEFFETDSIDGSLDISYAVKLPKSYRVPNTFATTPIPLYGGGKTTIEDDLTINNGCFRMYGSDGITLVASIANDAGHSGDGSIEDEKENTNGLTLKGPGNFYGDLKVFWESCQSTGVCNVSESIKMTAAEGDIFIGQKYYQKGKVLEIESAAEKMFHVDNLGSAGAGGTVGPKDFTIYHNNAIDSFGIEKYWTANGGRRHTYVAFDITTGIGQQETNPLQVNNNYLVNCTSGSNMVLYLPDNAQTGDMIRFTELSGNLTYNTSLIIRAKKINAVATSIQGDSTGSKLDAGSGQTRTSAWDSGELVIQTRNSAFGLVYVGTYDIEGSTSQQTIPPSLRGWWLMEL